MPQMTTAELKYKLDWMDKAFHAHLKKQFSEVAVEQVKGRFDEFMELEYNNVTDKQSQGHIRMCAMTLAYYEELNADSGALEEMKFAVASYGAVWIKRMTKLTFSLSFNRRKTLEKISYQKMRSIYGESFHIEADRAANNFITRVTKCAYNDFFNRHGRPELTSCFCEWDMNWASVLIENPNFGIEFSRDCTLAKGDESCDFCFKFY